MMKKFLEKKRNLRFKLLGEGQGHRLTESNASSSSSNNEQTETKEMGMGVEEKRSAALAAALERSLRNNRQKPVPRKFGCVPELQKASIIDKQNFIREDSQNMPLQPECSSTTTSSLYFKCPAIGDDVLHTKAEWQNIITEHIESLKAADPILAAILSIKSLNRPEKTEECLSVLIRYIQNLITYPDIEKYKSIRMANRNFNDKVLKVVGALEFLESIGFKRTIQEETEEYLVFDPTSDVDLEDLFNSLIELDGFELVLDRDFKLEELTESASAETFVVPDDFFELTVAEVKREHKNKTDQLEKESCLMTKKMKELDKSRGVKKHPLYTRLKIRLPNNFQIQGTFSVSEKFKSLHLFLDDNLTFGGDYILQTPPTYTFTLEDNVKTFQELNLFPAVTLNLKTTAAISFKNSI